MLNKKEVFLVLFMIVAVSLFSNIISGNYYNSKPVYDALHLLDKNLLRMFLEEQYVVEVGLLRAARFVYPENVTIYVANDNVLAARALAVLGSPLATRVLYVLNHNFSGGWNGKVDVLLGRNIPDEFYASYNEYVGEINGYTILYEKLNRSIVIMDWYNYADLLVYYALDKLLMGSRSEAERAFINLTRMWDGYGFRDNPVKKRGVYDVYKCALYIYLFRALDAAGSKLVSEYRYIYDKCLEIITMAQDPVFGGIYTNYRVVENKIVILKDKGYDMNTETTSIVVLAIYSSYPEIIGSRDC